MVSDTASNGIRSRGDNETRWILAVNEIGIYEALFRSVKLELCENDEIVGRLFRASYGRNGAVRSQQDSFVTELGLF